MAAPDLKIIEWLHLPARVQWVGGAEDNSWPVENWSNSNNKTQFQFKSQQFCFFWPYKTQMSHTLGLPKGTSQGPAITSDVLF